MIGDIIKEQRLKKNMTRKTLAEGICTEKYIYLIERNERNPSAQMVNNFSQRLGIDLFEYYELLDHKDKNLVYQYKAEFERYIALGDIEALKRESLKASKLEDFQKEPLCYDIMVIEFIYEALIEGQTSDVIKKVNNILKIKQLNIDPITLINAYVALSTCYQMEGQLIKAKEVIELAYDMIRDKTELSSYNTVIISVLISMTSLLYHSKEYEELIKYSDSLIAFQEKNSEYNRIYYVDFYLSIAYYKTNKVIKSKEHFMRGLYSALLFKNKWDITFIISMEEFSEVAKGLTINQYLLDQLYSIESE